MNAPDATPCGARAASPLAGAAASGPWAAERVDAFLGASVLPLRLACASREGGPLVASLWYVWDGDALWCATRATSRVAQVLWEEPRCGFEVAGDAPPYRGVRGQGRAVLLPEHGDRVLRRLVHRYLGGEEAPLARWLLGRGGVEVAIRIAPRRFASWDYAARMGGATAPAEARP
jgi:hypothetical protein